MLFIYKGKKNKNLLKVKMGFFSSIDGFFQDAARKINDNVLKPIGKFITETVPTYGGKIIDSIKGVGKTVIDKLPVIVDKIGGIGRKVIDKGKEIAGKVFDKVNPLNQVGFYVALGLGAFLLIELFNSKAGETFAS